MSEHPSPPGPREMVQEHRVINTYSGIQFEEETPPEPQADTEPAEGEQD